MYIENPPDAAARAAFGIPIAYACSPIVTYPTLSDACATLRLITKLQQFADSFLNMAIGPPNWRAVFTVGKFK